MRPDKIKRPGKLGFIATPVARARKSKSAIKLLPQGISPFFALVCAPARESETLGQKLVQKRK
jgi:hypothetical protein